MLDLNENELCKRYLSGTGTYTLGRELGVTPDTVAAALRRNGIAIRSGSEANRKYACDHGFFDEIDTEAKAYWLGFVAADGCVTGGYLKVSLSARDRNHLVTLKSDIGSEHPLQDYNVKGGFGGSPQSRLAIKSPELASALALHGIVPRKTGILEWPTALPAGLVRHYLRGYFDGDGSFVVRRHVKPAYARWSIVGSEAFCLGAQSYLMETVEVSKVKLDRSRAVKGVVYLRYQGLRQVARILRLMYEDTTVWLPRKRDKALPYMA